MVPALAAHHEWLYRERDPNQSGLVTLIHLVQDVSFNALFTVANRDLVSPADQAGISLTPELHTRMDATPDALESLWEDGAGMYSSRDASTGALLAPPRVASFSVL